MNQSQNYVFVERPDVTLDGAVEILREQLKVQDLASRLTKLARAPERHPFSKDFLMLKFIYQDLKTLDGFPPSTYKDQLINQLNDVLQTGMQYAETSRNHMQAINILENSLAEATKVAEQAEIRVNEAERKLLEIQVANKSLSARLNETETSLKHYRQRINEIQSVFDGGLVRTLLFVLFRK